jgi:D-3-phosphoglycerate dehydrogenase
MTFNVVITDCSWDDNTVERTILAQVGAHVSRAQCTTPEEVVSACRDADALLVGWAPVNAEVIIRLKKCRLMVRYGTGYNNIDIDAASRAGIAVAINADYCVEEVATHAFALLLACHRQLAPLTDSVRRGVWDPLAVMAPMQPLSRSTVGVLGYGRIGRRFAQMAAAVASRILICDPFVSSADRLPAGCQVASFGELLGEADFISIHVPLTSETERLFGVDTLAKMKPGAYLINCSRGPIVDENALAEALRAGRIGGAALDVFTQEPLPMDHPLRGFSNVIITPHAAWFSSQSNHLLRANPAEMIVRFFRGESIPLVNGPTRSAV